MESASLKMISDCFIKPKFISEEAKKPTYMAPWDLAMLKRVSFTPCPRKTKKISPPPTSCTASKARSLQKRLKRQGGRFLSAAYSFELLKSIHSRAEEIA